MSSVNINPPESGDILVVDDSVTNLELLAIILGEAGYRARSVANGELALRSVQARQPALILLDIKMPGMNGFEVCRRLKAKASTRDIPVIFLSSQADTADKLKGFELGAVDYITKSFHNTGPREDPLYHDGYQAAARGGNRSLFAIESDNTFSFIGDDYEASLSHLDRGSGLCELDFMRKLGSSPTRRGGSGSHLAFGKANSRISRRRKPFARVHARPHGTDNKYGADWT